LPEYNVLEIRTPLLNESRYLADEILRMNQKKKEVLSQLGTSKSIKKIFRSAGGGPGLSQRSADYYQDHFDQVIKVLDLPYIQALQVFEEVQKSRRTISGPEKRRPSPRRFYPRPSRKYMVTAFVSEPRGMHSLRPSTCTGSAQRTAHCPKSCRQRPPDLFSGRPFTYEITPDGFILRCNEKDRTKIKSRNTSLKSQISPMKKGRHFGLPLFDISRVQADSRYQIYSTVAGGLGVRSYRHRLTPGICVIRSHSRFSFFQGSSVAEAVRASTLSYSEPQ